MDFSTTSSTDRKFISAGNLGGCVSIGGGFSRTSFRVRASLPEPIREVVFLDCEANVFGLTISAFSFRCKSDILFSFRRPADFVIVKHRRFGTRGIVYIRGKMCPTPPRDGKVSLDSNLEQLKEAFAVLDRDGDGIIATSDLELFLQASLARKLISKEDVKGMLALVDGNVDLEQFLNLLHFEPMSDVSAISREENDDQTLRAMFHALDKNGDGFVCEEDLKSMVNSLGPRFSEKDVLAMLDGTVIRTFLDKITYEEFVTVMTTLRPANGFSVLRPVLSN